MATVRLTRSLQELVFHRAQKTAPEPTPVHHVGEMTAAKAIDMKVFPPGPKSQAMSARMDNAIARTNYIGLYGIVFDVHQGADGPYMTDLDGNVYLDCLAAGTVNTLGYGRKDIATKLGAIAGSMQNSGFVYSPNVPAIELAETLISMTPGKHAKRVVLGLTGSNSNSDALKAVHKFTKGQSMIYFRNAMHGSTGLSQCVSTFGDTKYYTDACPLKFLAVDFPTTQEKAEEVLEQIQKYLDTDLVGGMIVEIIQTDSGILIPPAGFFPALHKKLRDKGALLVVDEVQSGMGRTGKWWACEHEGIIPDLLVVGKGLGGGFAPITAIIGRQDVLDALDPAQEKFSFTGHPICASAASLVIETIQNNGLAQHAKDMGDRLRKALMELQKIYPEIIVDVRGIGLMLGMEINIESDEIAGKVFATRCVEKGIYVGFFGVYQEVIRIEPPLTIGEREVDIIVSKFTEVAEEMRIGQIPKETIENIKKYAMGLQCKLESKHL